MQHNGTYGTQRVTQERLNELLRGPLNHDSIGFRSAKLILALWAVIQATGAAGEQALEQHCAQTAAEDKS